MILPSPASGASVVLATFNGATYVAGQLRSILEQLRSGDELIVTDDGSTDSTVPLVLALQDPRIRLLEHERLGTPARNFEFGLKQATRPIVVLSDQDDLWLPGRLDRARNLLAGMSGCSLVMNDGELMDQTGNRMGRSIFDWLRPRHGVMANLIRNTFIGCCIAFRRELLDLALPFPPGVPMHDWWLGLLAERYGDVLFLPEKLVLYRRHQASVTARPGSVVQAVRWRIDLMRHLRARGAAAGRRP